MKIRTLHHRKITLATAILSLCGTQLVMADDSATASMGAATNTNDFVSGAKVSGYVRAYEWTSRNYYFNSGWDTNNTLLGGKLKVESGSVGGFSAGAALYTAHALNRPRDTPTPNYDPTMGNDMDTLGEAYVNYRNQGFNIRVGRQTIETPLASSMNSDFRMIPDLYQGVTMDWNPDKNYGFSAGWINRYKNWAQSGFTPTTNYGPYSQYQLAGLSTSGFWFGNFHSQHALGGDMKLNNQLWYYNFNSLARTVFVDENLSFNNSGYYKPFIGFQYINQKDTGAARLGRVDSTPYGAKLGVDFGQSSVSGAVMHFPVHAGAFNNGGLASPYTSGNGSAGLLTGNMLFPTEDLGSGNVYQLAASHKFNDSWSAWAAYDRFNGSAISKVNLYVLSVTYNTPVKGLSVTNMLGYATQPSPVSTSNTSTFLQNRLMAQYSF